jgi:hypothetical protein
MYDTNNTSYNFGSLFKTSGGSLLLEIIIGIIAFIIIFIGLNYLYSYIISDVPKLKFKNPFHLTTTN